jgi:hypothetical protein
MMAAKNGLKGGASKKRFSGLTFQCRFDPSIDCQPGDFAIGDWTLP